MTTKPAVYICSMDEIDLSPFEISHRSSDRRRSSRLRGSSDCRQGRGEDNPWDHFDYLVIQLMPIAVKTQGYDIDICKRQKTTLAYVGARVHILMYEDGCV